MIRQLGRLFVVAALCTSVLGLFHPARGATDPALETFKKHHDTVRDIWRPLLSLAQSASVPGVGGVLTGIDLFNHFLTLMLKGQQTSLPQLLEAFANDIKREVNYTHEEKIMSDASGLITFYKGAMSGMHGLTQTSLENWLQETQRVASAIEYRIENQTCDLSQLPRLALIYNTLAPLRAFVWLGQDNKAESERQLRKLIDINQILMGPFTFSTETFSQIRYGETTTWTLPYNIPSYARVLGKLHVRSGSSYEVADMPMLKDFGGTYFITPSSYHISAKYDCELLHEPGFYSTSTSSDHRRHRQYDDLMQILWDSTEQARETLWQGYDLGHMKFLIENDEERGLCISASNSGNITLENCNDNDDSQKWQLQYERYDGVRIKNNKYGSCISVRDIELYLGPCDQSESLMDVRGTDNGATLRPLVRVGQQGGYPSGQSLIGVYPQKPGMYYGVVVWFSTNVGVEVPRALRWRIAATGGEEIFYQPMNDEYRLDWCRFYGSDCGERTADDFCRSKGFSGVVDYSKAENIGARSATKTLYDEKVCRSEGCDGFSYIRCEGAAGGVYMQPRLEEHRLDRCWGFARQCEREAVAAFCENKGYTWDLENHRWQVEHNIGSDWHPTETIGTGELCRPKSCDGFSYIQCWTSYTEYPSGWTRIGGE